jgi:hypothetical protein
MKVTRRQFIKGVASAGVFVCGSRWFGAKYAFSNNGIYVNAEEENLLTVDYLVDAVFKHDPVSCHLLDPVRSIFIPESEHLTDGYRKISDVSYPCFTSEGGHRIELHQGIWNGNGHDTNLKLISHLTGALDFINNSGGIGGKQVQTEDENIEVLLASEIVPNSGEGGTVDDGSAANDSGSGGGACFISTAADRSKYRYR